MQKVDNSNPCNVLWMDVFHRYLLNRQKETKKRPGMAHFNKV